MCGGEAGGPRHRGGGGRGPGHLLLLIPHGQGRGDDDGGGDVTADTDMRQTPGQLHQPQHLTIIIKWKIIYSMHDTIYIQML